MKSNDGIGNTTGRSFSPAAVLPIAQTTSGLYALSSQVQYHKRLDAIPHNTDLRTTLELLDVSLATPLASYVGLLLANTYSTLLHTPARERRFRQALGDAASYTADSAEQTAWMAVLPYLSLGCDPELADQAASLVAFWVACTHLDDAYDRKLLRNNRRTARGIWGEAAAFQAVTLAQDEGYIKRMLLGDNDAFAALWHKEFARVLGAERRKLSFGQAGISQHRLPTLFEYRQVATDRLQFFGDFFTAMAEQAGRPDMVRFFTDCYPWFAWQSQIRNDLKNHGMTNAGRDYDSDGLPLYHGESGELFSDITDGRVTFSTVIFFEQGRKSDVHWVLSHIWNRRQPLTIREYRYLLDVFQASGVLETIMHKAAEVDALVESMLLHADIPEPVRDLWYGWYFRQLKTFIAANYRDPNPYRLRSFRDAVRTLTQPACDALPALRFVTA